MSPGEGLGVGVVAIVVPGRGVTLGAGVWMGSQVRTGMVPGGQMPGLGEGVATGGLGRGDGVIPGFGLGVATGAATQAQDPGLTTRVPQSHRCPFCQELEPSSFQRSPVAQSHRKPRGARESIRLDVPDGQAAGVELAVGRGLAVGTGVGEGEGSGVPLAVVTAQ